MIVFDHVTKTYPGGVTAVDSLSLEIAEGETLVLLGTSGSGKTTTMKMVNRLIEPTFGTITIRGRDIMDQNSIDLRRGIGYAIQHIGLFPHMTVAKNIATVPRLLGWSKAKIDERIDELLTMVGLKPEDYRDRYPAQLSGGQKQRIGVARALAADPPVVLMDEPFGALDPLTRESLQDEFVELQERLKKTIVFVTHDVFEAVKMGDRIALMDAGVLQQLATPAQIVQKPANEFVDSFLGEHRFQLTLLTRHIGGVMQPPQEGLSADGPKLSKSDTISDALDAFKRTDREELAVYDEHEKLVGQIHKDHVLDVVELEMTGGSRPRET